MLIAVLHTLDILNTHCTDTPTPQPMHVMIFPPNIHHMCCCRSRTVCGYIYYKCLFLATLMWMAIHYPPPHSPDNKYPIFTYSLTHMTWNTGREGVFAEQTCCAPSRLDKMRISWGLTECFCYLWHASLSLYGWNARVFSFRCFSCAISICCTYVAYFL